MTHRMLVGAMVTAASVLAAPALARAQAATSGGVYLEPAVVTMSFPFMVGGKTLPAGKYSIEAMTRETLIFQEEKPGAARVEVPVITRLAAPASPIAEPKVIFDKIGDQYWLSEVWLPGADGFLLYGTKDAHTHRAVKGEKKAKK